MSPSVSHRVKHFFIEFSQDNELVFSAHATHNVEMKEKEKRMERKVLVIRATFNYHPTTNLRFKFQV